MTVLMSPDEEVSGKVLPSGLRGKVLPSGDLLGSRRLCGSSLMSSSHTCSIRGSIARSVIERSDDLNLDDLERSL